MSELTTLHRTLYTPASHRRDPVAPEPIEEFRQYMLKTDRNSGTTLSEYEAFKAATGHRLSISDKKAILGDKFFLRIDFGYSEKGQVQRLYFPK